MCTKIKLDSSTVGCQRVASRQLDLQAFSGLSHCQVLGANRRGGSRKDISPCSWSRWLLATAPRASPIPSWSIFAGWLHQSWQRESKLAREEITKIRTLLDFLNYIFSNSPLLFTFGSQHGEQHQLRAGKVGVPVIKVDINESHLCWAKLLDKRYLW